MPFVWRSPETNAFAFRQIIPLPSGAGYRSIVVEPLGVGDSSRPKKADYSLTAQGDRIESVLDQLHVENAVVMSHAIGTFVALRLAYRHPARVRAVGRRGSSTSGKPGVLQHRARPGSRSFHFRGGPRSRGGCGGGCCPRWARDAPRGALSAPLRRRRVGPAVSSRFERPVREIGRSWLEPLD